MFACEHCSYTGKRGVDLNVHRTKRRHWDSSHSSSLDSPASNFCLPGPLPSAEDAQGSADMAMATPQDSNNEDFLFPYEHDANVDGQQCEISEPLAVALSVTEQRLSVRNSEHCAAPDIGVLKFLAQPVCTRCCRATPYPTSTQNDSHVFRLT